MVDSSIIDSVRRYLVGLPRFGIHASRAVLFGSSVRGGATPESDIDLVVIAPEFDGPREIEQVEGLWRATVADDRIEPIPCGEREWEMEGGRPILDIARRDGVVIAIMPPESEREGGK